MPQESHTAFAIQTANRSVSVGNSTSAQSRPTPGAALPLLDLVGQALKLQAERQTTYRADMGSAWPETDDQARRDALDPVHDLLDEDDQDEN